MVIRPMTTADLTAVLAIENELFPTEAWSKDVFLSELAQVPTTRRVSVIQENDEIVGYASLSFAGRQADINTIAIATSHQRNGLGQELLDWLTQTAKEVGARELFLEVRADNEAAIQMYRGNNFERIDIRRNYYGNAVDAHVMRKKLS